MSILLTIRGGQDKIDLYGRGERLKKPSSLAKQGEALRGILSFASGCFGLRTARLPVIVEDGRKPAFGL
jgi:hypothetical protein